MTNVRAEDRYNRLASAVELLRNGYRTRIVQAATGLPAGAIRKLCSSVLGKPATPGQLPEASSVTISWGRCADAALFAGIYHEIGGESIYRNVDPYLVLHAHSIYQIVREQIDRMPTRRSDERPKILDINHAWVIARDLRAKTAVLAVCSNLGCRYHNLLVVGSHKQLACALCLAPARPISQASHRCTAV
jgi:flagellar transcriptional activator FlhC